MHSSIPFLMALLAGSSSASPISTSRDVLYSDTYTDMYSVIAGGFDCRPVALIFARGTFDSGNVGVWVGPELITSLASDLPSPSSLAAQGVDGTLYPATLSTYLTEGGSNDGAKALAQTVTSYATKCPSSAIIISGWSQGALVVHKGIAQLDSTVLGQVAGVVTFGDPWHLFDNTPLPSAINASTVQSYCFDGIALDPLCAALPPDEAIPDTLAGVTAPFLGLPSIAHGAQQVKAAASLVVRFPAQLLASWSSFVATFGGGKDKFVRLLLTPQHFEYGNSGGTDEAAAFIAQLPMVRKAVQS